MTAALVVTPKPFSSHLLHHGPREAQTPCSAVPPKHKDKKHRHLAAVGQGACFLWADLGRRSQPWQEPPPPSATSRAPHSLCQPTRPTGPAPRSNLPHGCSPGKMTEVKRQRALGVWELQGKKAKSPWGLGAATPKASQPSDTSCRAPNEGRSRIWSPSHHI